jgi:hypothetical protein
MNANAPLRQILLAAVLALPALAQMAPDVRLNVGTTASAGQATAPRIAASGDAVCVVWQDGRNGPLPDIYCNRSIDGGATWLANDVRLDQGTLPGASGSYAPQIAASGSSVSVVWEDTRNGASDIYYNRSLDGGATWLPVDVRLDTGDAPGASHSRQPQIAMWGSWVYVVWSDSRHGASDIYCNRSLDGGATWLPAAVRLDTGSPPGASPSEGPRIAAVGPLVAVTWTDLRNSATNADVYFNRSFDGGSTWLANDVRLDVGTAAGSANSLSPEIASTGSEVHVTWCEVQNGTSAVCLNRSWDGGNNWSASVRQLGSQTANAVSPHIVALGQSVYVTWSDYRNGPAADVFSNCSHSGGVSWLANDARLDVGSAPGAFASVNPRIASSGSVVYVVWEESRTTTTPCIYANRSLDGGNTWLPIDLRLDASNGPGIAGARSPEVACTDSRVFVVWVDGRHTGASNIYFTLGFGHQAYGSGTAGFNSLVPTLSCGGLAAIGGSVMLDLRGLGGAPGVLVMGLGAAAQVAQPLLGGTLLVRPEVTQFLLLGGPVGVPGVGAQSLTVPVPNNLGLLGLDANFQGLFLDGGAVQGVSMSNAIAVWIG